MSEQRSYAQWGGYRLVWDYFHRKPHCFLIEGGAIDPINVSQTYLLEQNGWEGLLVEPQKECCKRLQPARPWSRVIQAASCSTPGQEGKALCRKMDLATPLRQPKRALRRRKGSVPTIDMPG